MCLSLSPLFHAHILIKMGAYVSVSLSSHTHTTSQAIDIVIATQCNSLQHTATHCITLQHTTTHCNNTATYCNSLQHTATPCNTQDRRLCASSCLPCCSVLQCVAVCCSVLQCVAVCCSVLQCVAVCCSVLQCVAVCCSVLQLPYPC